VYNKYGGGEGGGGREGREGGREGEREGGRKGTRVAEGEGNKGGRAGTGRGSEREHMEGTRRAHVYMAALRILRKKRAQYSSNVGFGFRDQLSGGGIRV